MVKYNPHLPIDLVNTLGKEYNASEVSFSHIPPFQDIRLQILDPRIPGYDTNTLFDSGGDAQGYPEGAKIAWIHQAATFGDVIFTCELIRLGANVNVLDFEGFPPLHVALQMWNALKTSIVLDYGLVDVEEGTNTCERLRKMITILIQHHADVNYCRGADRRSPLQYACFIGDWDIIELLIQYGANPSPLDPDESPSTHFSREATQRLEAIIKKHAKNEGKPPLPCPCFSGLPLIDCHAKSDKPYPDHHTCVCASGKTFGSCCGRRNIDVHEEWDEVNRRIKIQIEESTISDPAEEYADHPLHAIKEEIQRKPCFKPERGKTVDILRQLNCKQKFIADAFVGVSWKVLALCKIEEIGRAVGISDPAFNFAAERAGFVPWPTGKQRSKIFCQARQMQWNKLVDEYIRTSGDKRAKIEIERVAKLGSSLGALHQICEGENCEIMAGREVGRLRTCSGCKMAMYCNSDCQAGAWASHRRVCGKPGQREQTLPSQEKLDRFVWEQLARADTWRSGFT